MRPAGARALRGAPCRGASSPTGAARPACALRRRPPGPKNSAWTARDGVVERRLGDDAAHLHLRRADAVDVDAAIGERREHPRAPGRASRRCASRRWRSWRRRCRSRRGPRSCASSSRGSASLTASMSSLSMMNVIRLRSCAGAAWMIRRTLTLGVGQIAEDVRRRCRADRLTSSSVTLAILLVRRHADDRGGFHHGGSFTNPRALASRRSCRRTWMGTLYCMQISAARGCSTLAPAGGQLDALFVAQLRHAARVGDDARIGGVDAVDVGAVLVRRALQRRREDGAGDVAAAASERGDVVVDRHALEAGDDDDAAGARAPGPGERCRPPARAPC